MEQWSVLIRDHHPGFIDWATFEANQARLDSNTKPKPHQAGGAVRGGSALLQGIVTCGHCGRRLHVHYRGRNSAPGYHCCGKDLVNGRGVYCLNVGETVIEQAVAETFLQAITPAAIEATRLSVEQLQANHDAALSQWRLEVERTRYEAERAERRYRAVEPENRLVARGLETEWENRLHDLAAAGPPPPLSEIVIRIPRPAFVSAMPASFAAVGEAIAIPPDRLSPGVRCFSPHEPALGAIPLRLRNGSAFCAASRR
jgi:hypothetical protein